MHDERPHAQPAWLSAAWAEYGQAERKGARAHNPRVVALYRDAGFSQIDNDEVAWCAAFVGACLQRSGISPTRSLMARSYSRWGQGLGQSPAVGCIAVLSRGSDPALGHVGFVVGQTADTLFLLGGNQSDAVTVAAYPKSRLVALRWPSETAAEQATPHTSTDSPFANALEHVLAMEGGMSDDPYDPGGPTNKGITLGVYADWKGQRLSASTRANLLSALKAIPDKEVEQIYRQRYWDKAGCDQLPAAVALMHFDTAVNQGPGTAVRILQETIGTAADGIIGPLTLKALRAMPVETILRGYAENRRQRYRIIPHFWRFGRGWLKRVDKTLALASQMATSTRQSPIGKGDGTMEQATKDDGKWWGNSMTIWGAITTGLAAILPVAGKILGLELSSELVTQLGSQAVTAAQAIIALLGTMMTIAGRVRASQPIERRAFTLKL